MKISLGIARYESKKRQLAIYGQFKLYLLFNVLCIYGDSCDSTGLANSL